MQIHNILKKDGTLYLMEFGHANQSISTVYNIYRKYGLPLLGKVFDNEKSYQYLADSIAGFWTDQELRENIINCGFYLSEFKLLSQGIVRIIVAHKM